MKHSPGPWTVEGPAYDDLRIKDARGFHISLITGGMDDYSLHGMMGPTSVANATLIASAPDLLQVLLSVEEYLSSSNYATDCASELREVRAAIAKAEGKP